VCGVSISPCRGEHDCVVTAELETGVRSPEPAREVTGVEAWNGMLLLFFSFPLARVWRPRARVAQRTARLNGTRFASRLRRVMIAEPPQTRAGNATPREIGNHRIVIVELVRGVQMLCATVCVT
jgi:hypothetical protein